MLGFVHDYHHAVRKLWRDFQPESAHRAGGYVQLRTDKFQHGFWWLDARIYRYVCTVCAVLTVILPASLCFAYTCVTAGYGKTALKLTVAYDLVHVRRYWRFLIVCADIDFSCSLLGFKVFNYFFHLLIYIAVVGTWLNCRVWAIGYTNLFADCSRR